MSVLSHLYKIDQKVRCNLDGAWYNGKVKEVGTNYIIVDIPDISDYCKFENGFNIDRVYPEYNFIN